MTNKVGYKRRVAKKTKLKKLAKQEAFYRDFTDDIAEWQKKGFSKEQAIQQTKGEVTAIDRLVQRYKNSVNVPGVIGISLQGIRRTKKVEGWIDDMEKKGMLMEKAGSLIFPPNPSLKRPGVHWERVK
jgi:hypothetical protein